MESGAVMSATLTGGEGVVTDDEDAARLSLSTSCLASTRLTSSSRALAVKAWWGTVKSVVSVAGGWGAATGGGGESDDSEEDDEDEIAGRGNRRVGMFLGG